MPDDGTQKGLSRLPYDGIGDPFAVTAVLSRQLSVTRKEWLKYTANHEDPDAPLYTQGTLAKALQTPGNEHLVTNSSFLTASPPPEPSGVFSFATMLRNRSIFGLPILKPTSKVRCALFSVSELDVATQQLTLACCHMCHTSCCPACMQ